METHAGLHQSMFIDTGAESPGEPGVANAEIDPDTLRSENNILCWMTYLPQDCIDRMIEMGWDITT